MLLEEMTEVHNTSVIQKDNQVASLLAKNRQVGFFTKHIGDHNNFLRDMIFFT